MPESKSSESNPSKPNPGESEPRKSGSDDSKPSFNPEPWIRPNIRTLTPYHAARDDYHEGILLDANENSFGPAIPTDLPLHRYPDTRLNDLRQKWAGFRGIRMEQVFVGVGSDEAIDLLMRVFCEPGRDEIIITPPTYGMYKVAARINNVGVSEAELTKNFELNARAVLQRVNQHTKLIMLCSPNNPTANVLSQVEIERILKDFNRLVVVDEAYIDFSDSGSLCHLLDNYPNLVILQTLSKSFGMAAVRMGAALAHPKVIEWMMKVKAPYNVNQLTADAAMLAFDHVDKMREKVRNIITERNRLAAALAKHPDVETIFPSDANFLLVRMRGALEWYKRLADRGVIVRYRGDQLHCEDTLRITVGTTPENDQLISELYDSKNASDH
ncbi:MAG: histidinol-phosphate transaminase [Balneolaceae bacterium]|nr:MAG: histidinol-phosphate transaminase [Balneolaceae bacterium]